MEKAAAADFLGVSLRTVDRLVASGRLTKGRKRGRTRPVPVFDEAELKALKEELGTARPEPLADGRTLPSVGFRLEPAYFERLKSRGAGEGFSPGEYARHLVVQSLETDADALLKGFSDLRKGLGEMLLVLLISRLDMTEKEARDLLKKTALRTGEKG